MTAARGCVWGRSNHAIGFVDTFAEGAAQFGGLFWFGRIDGFDDTSGSICGVLVDADNFSGFSCWRTDFCRNCDRS